MKRQRRKHAAEFKARKNKDIKKDKQQLHSKVGQLTMEVDFLEKEQPFPVVHRV